jgi:hypothetical protein
MPAIPAAMPTPARVPPPPMAKAGIESCYRCRQSRHISSNCPLRYDICHMTTNEQDDMIEKLLANHDDVLQAFIIVINSDQAFVLSLLFIL